MDRREKTRENTTDTALAPSLPRSHCPLARSVFGPPQLTGVQRVVRILRDHVRPGRIQSNPFFLQSSQALFLLVLYFSETTPVGRPARVSRKHSFFLPESLPIPTGGPLTTPTTFRGCRPALIYLSHPRKHNSPRDRERERDERTKRFPLDRLSVTERQRRGTDVRARDAGALLLPAGVRETRQVHEPSK